MNTPPPDSQDIRQAITDVVYVVAGQIDLLHESHHKMAKEQAITKLVALHQAAVAEAERKAVNYKLAEMILPIKSSPTPESMSRGQIISWFDIELAELNQKGKA